VHRKAIDKKVDGSSGIYLDDLLFYGAEVIVTPFLRIV